MADPKERLNMHKKTFTVILIAGALIIVGSFAYGGYRYYQVVNQLIATQQQLIGSTETSGKIISGYENVLSQARGENTTLSENLAAERARMEDFANQISGISGTVGILDKLSKTDKELLQKYSKVYFLNEHYVPSALVEIPSNYWYPADKPQKIHTSVLPFLAQLLGDALSSGVDLKVLSAFRSFYEQADVKSGYKIVFGTGANKFSADQGYSEHQLGTTADFTTLGNGSTLSNFEKTSGFPWLQAHAYQYGFTLSYPKNNAYYIYEPWHWRFVGLALAKKLHDDGKYFYDLDQRDIDAYLVNIFDPLP